MKRITGLLVMLVLAMSVSAMHPHMDGREFNEHEERKLNAEMCPELHQPVCGIDGKTYGNACRAKMMSVAVGHQGPCSPDVERSGQMKEEMRTGEKARIQRELNKDQLKQERRNLHEQKEKLKECRGRQTQECRKTREQTPELVKNRLLEVIDKQLAVIAQMKQRPMEGIDEQAKQEIMSEIESAEKKIQDLKQSIETAQGLTLQEFKTRAKELETAVKEANKVMRKSSTLGAVNKIHNAAAMITKNADKVQAILDKDAAKQAEYSTRLEEIRTQIKELAELEQTIKEHVTAKNLESANKTLKQAHDLIRKAHKNLQSIVRDLRAKSGESEQPKN